MLKHIFLKLFIFCALICVGQITKVSAQSCVDMTALGQNNVIHCYEEHLQEKVISSTLTFCEWDSTKSSYQHPYQKLITTAGKDALCPQLSTLPPSGEPCILLTTDGSSYNTSPKGAGVIFRIQIDKDNPILILNFAGMMEKTIGIHTDYSHDVTNYGDYIQPSIFFQLTVDKEDSLIQETPVTFTPNAAKTWPTFTDTRGRTAVWRDWTSIAYDLSKFIGRQVNVYARIRDCALAGIYKDPSGIVTGFKICEDHHTARAYVNVTCAPHITLDVQDCGKRENKLSMPEGFVSYKWYYQSEPENILGTERNVTISTNHKNDTLCCEVVHYVIETPVVKKFFLTNNCMHCADHDNITYSVSPDLGEVETYSVLFDDAAKAQGFVDITDATPSSPNMVSVAMPKHENSYVRPDNYSAQIILQIAGQTKKDTLSWDFNILYPSSVIGQDWNDVLYIKNKDFNGGFNFSQIKWFRNEESVEGQGEHNGYMVNPYSFNGNDVFVAELTRTDDGKTIRTCPCQPVSSNPDEIDFGVQVYTAPGRLHISSANISGEFRVYDLCGNLFANGQFGPKTNATELDVQVTWPMGVYVLQLNREDGKTENKKMLIF